MTFDDCIYIIGFSISTIYKENILVNISCLVAAIDPGQFQSAYVIFDITNDKILDCGILANEEFLVYGKKNFARASKIIIEVPKSYGMAIGDSILETCIFIGRIIESAPVLTERIPRKTVVNTICKRATGNDKSIRQALIDYFTSLNPNRYISSKIKVTSKNEPLALIKKDIWAALAVAIAWKEIEKYKTMELLT